jgi:hypothetical protein
MRRSFVLVGFIVLLPVIAFSADALAQEISVDATNSTIEASSQDTIKIRYTSAVAPWLGLLSEAKYWGEFRWDPFNYTLYPIAYGEETVAPPYADRQGTYSLKGFYVNFSDGSTFTEKDVAISGTMRLGATSVSQVMVIEGNTFPMTGTYVPTFTKGSSTGIFTFRDASGTHDAYFWISGYELTTFSGIVRLNSTTAFREWDYWVKVNDSITTEELSSTSQPGGLHSESGGAGLAKGIGYLLRD